MSSARLPKGLRRAKDGCVRCAWSGEHADYIDYHDTEWGRPVVDDQRLFEKICLEGFQAGLSWLTILRKRDAFRRAFKDFDPAKVARFNERSVERLLADSGIVRHRGKIEAAIENARRSADLADEFGSLAGYFWRFEPSERDRPRRLTYAALKRLTETAESRAMSRDLRSRGWRFVGPTTLYAFMQSMGIVNDHIEGCAHRSVSEKARDALRRPEWEKT
jgi:DNA-3-methyladenine glycosylase I